MINFIMKLLLLPYNLMFCKKNNAVGMVYLESINKKPLIYLDRKANWKTSPEQSERMFTLGMFDFNQEYHKEFMFQALMGQKNDVITQKDLDSIKRKAKEVLKNGGWKKFSSNLETKTFTPITKEDKEKIQLLLKEEL